MSPHPDPGILMRIATATTQTPKREAFGSRNVFILSAIGSAVGLGNIWRFPYLAYEGGGGAFLIPYLCALLTAGIPLLFFDYAIGHRFRGSAPLAFRRMHRGAEPLGWWQVLICVVIAVYYAVIIAWAAMCTSFSAQLTWGPGNENDFFFIDFLRSADVAETGISTEFVPQVGIPLAIVSLALFSTTTASSVLDTADAFVNAFGIMAVALVAVIVVAWLLHKLPALVEHLDRRSSFRVGRFWMLLVGALAPLVLGYLLVTELISKISEPHGGYPGWFLAVFGWGMVIALVAIALLLSALPWSGRSEDYEPDAETSSIPLITTPEPGTTEKGAGA